MAGKRAKPPKHITHNAPAPKLERIRTGIPGLDEMLKGGFVKNSTVVVQGGAGSAKTLMCLQYLHSGATMYDEPGAILTFGEDDDAIYQHGRMFGWDFQALVRKKKFIVIRYSPSEIVKIIGEGGGIIRDTLEELGVRRLVIDSVSIYELFFQNRYQATESILNLLDMLRKWKITTLITSELQVKPNGESKGNVEFLTDGVIHLYLLRTSAKRYRAIEVVKMRDTDHSSDIKLFEITSRGLSVPDGAGIRARD
jgi:circadian clock protein KaiC